MIYYDIYNMSSIYILFSSWRLSTDYFDFIQCKDCIQSYLIVEVLPSPVGFPNDLMVRLLIDIH